jgi:diguanylate cyclase (GGDEF)-like protein
LYNDNYGHVSGDKCLKLVAETLAATLSRPADLCARYGGEEFAIILPETQQAEVVAEKCRATVQALNIAHKFSTITDCVTISLGVCEIIPQVGSSPNIIIEYADNALYQAKLKGKNRVVVISNPLN